MRFTNPSAFGINPPNWPCPWRHPLHRRRRGRSCRQHATYRAPPNCKKVHLSKGRSKIAAIVRFAIDLLDAPLLQSVSKED